MCVGCITCRSSLPNASSGTSSLQSEKLIVSVLSAHFKLYFEKF